MAGIIDATADRTILHATLDLYISAACPVQNSGIQAAFFRSAMNYINNVASNILYFSYKVVICSSAQLDLLRMHIILADIHIIRNRHVRIMSISSHYS